MINFYKIGLGCSKFFLISLVFLISLIPFQGAHAFNLSIVNATFGDTISFERSICTRSSNPRFFIQEPSGRFVLAPDYTNVSIERSGSCGTSGLRRYHINGTISITEELQKGEYVINVRFSRVGRDNIYRDYFFVDSPSWKYSFEEEIDWNQKNFNDSNWNYGKMPFGDPDLLPGTNTDWVEHNKIYLRKIIYLDEYTQANLRMFAENKVTCYVNGERVGEHRSISALMTEECRLNGANRVQYGNLWVSTIEPYQGILFLDISEYLNPGENIIACVAEVEEDFYTYRFCRWVAGRRRCSTLYYPGRQYVDVEFSPLKENEIFWSYNSNDWEIVDSKKSIFWEYECRSTYISETGTALRYVQTKKWDGPWQWNELAITNDDVFYSKAEQYGWDRKREHSPLYWGASPFKRTTNFRRWIWAEEEKYVALRFASTSEPYCYLNEEKIDVYEYNTDYWNYFSEVKMKEGTNLIACRMASNSFDIFDINKTGLPGQLEITNVNVELKNNITNFKINLENTSNPETQIGVFIDLQKGNETKTVFSEVTSADISMAVGNKDYSYDFKEAIVILIQYNTVNVNRPGRAFDNDWNSFATISSGSNPAQLDEIYDLSHLFENQSLKIEELSFRYRARRRTEIHILNQKTNQFEKLFEHNSNAAYIENFEISNFTNYISENKTVHIRTKLLHNNARYYESEIIVFGIETKKQNYLQIISHSSTVMPINLEPGIYNVTISAVDAISGNQAIYFAELNLTNTTTTNLINPNTKQIGFFPFAGDGKVEETKGSGNSAIFLTASAAIVSASAGAYISSSKSTSPSTIKKIDSSMANIDKIISNLNNYQAYKINTNNKTFFHTWSEKFQQYKKNMEAREKEIARIEEERRRIIQERRRREEKLKQEGSTIIQNFKTSIAGLSTQEQSKAIDKFLNEHLNKKNTSFFKEDIRNVWNLNHNIKDYIEKVKIQEKARAEAEAKAKQAAQSNQSLFNPAFFGQNPLQNQQPIAHNQQPENNSWWNNFTGAASGLVKFAGIGVQNTLSAYAGMGSSLISGDVKGAAQDWYNHSKESASFLGSVVKENWKDITIAAGVGLAAGAIISFTGGLGAPLAKVVVGAAVSAGAFNIGKKYSEPLNKLNNAKDKDEIDRLYNKLRREMTGDTIKIGAGVAGAKFSYGLTHSYFHPPIKPAIIEYKNNEFIVKHQSPSAKIDYNINLENFKFFDYWKAKLKAEGWNLVKDNSLLKDGNLAETDFNKKTIKYTDQTKVGDFYHELIHYEQGPITDLQYDLQYAKKELQAYEFNLRYKELFGFGKDKIAEINKAINYYKLKIWRIMNNIK